MAKGTKPKGTVRGDMAQKTKPPAKPMARYPKSKANIMKQPKSKGK